MKGLHFIADVAECRCEVELLSDCSGFRDRCFDMVKAAGLTTVADTFHEFQGGGFSGCAVLAESHLAIHTWPERHAVTFDVYVCNYTVDNSAKARKLFDALIALFQPTKIGRYHVRRGELDAALRVQGREQHQLRGDFVRLL